MNEIKLSRQEIISLCRLCLAKDLASIDIFEDGSELRHLYTKIVACLPVQVFSNDTLPHKICKVCNAKVDDFYQFWTSTAKNQQQLNNWLQVATDHKDDHESIPPRIKVEVEENDDYDDNDDGGRADDSDDDEEEASAPKRIKTTHSDDEDTKPTHLVDSFPESDTNGKKKTKEHKSLTYNMDEAEGSKLQCYVCTKFFETRRSIKRHMKTIHLNKSKPFECAICRYRFATSKQVEQHTDIVHLGNIDSKLNRASHECPYCSTSLTTAGTLNRHIARKHPAMEILIKNKKTPSYLGDACTLEQWNELKKRKCKICPVCGNSFATPLGMRRHLRDVHNEQRVFVCELCGKQFASSRCAQEHKKIHEPRKKPIEKKYECDLCNRKFPAKKILLEHINVHTGNKPYKCTYCEASFSRRFSYQHHMKRHLQKEGKLKPEQLHKCNICNKTFLQSNRLKKHMDFTHGDAWLECKICGEKRKGSLRRHMLSHTGEKKITCHICGKSLRGKLAEHMLTHTGERPHTCDICGATFKSKWYMGVHYRKHTGDKPFQCKFCDKSFVLPFALKLHLEKHKGNGSKRNSKYFKCQLCKLAFENEDTLNSHQLSHFV